MASIPNSVVLVLAILGGHASAWAAPNVTRTIVVAYAAVALSGRKDAALEPKHYVLLDAGAAPWTIRNESLHRVRFAEMEGVLETALARMSWVRAPAGTEPEVIVTVQWGMTRYAPRIVPRTPQAWAVPGLGEMAEFEDQARRKMIDRQLELLGRAVYPRGPGGPPVVVPAKGFPVDGQVPIDLADRYYFIVQAFDYRSTVAQKTGDLLWSTRMSITAEGEDFAWHFERMLESGSKYFGRNAETTVQVSGPAQPVGPGRK